MKKLNWNLRTTLSEKPIPFFCDDLCAYIIVYYKDEYLIFSTYVNANFFEVDQISDVNKPECFKTYALKSKHNTLDKAKRAVRKILNDKDK